jgi:hypothetical protein
MCIGQSEGTQRPSRKFSPVSGAEIEAGERKIIKRRAHEALLLHQ